MKLIQSGTVAGILIGLLAGAEAQAQNYGVNFLGNTTDNVTGSAGVVSISGWNNIANSTFTSGSITADNLATATLTLGGSGATAGWHSGATSDGANGSLMNGYMDPSPNNPATLTIGGLASGQLFDVYLYIYSDASHPGNAGDFLPSYSVNGTTYFAPQLGSGTSAFTADSSTVGGPFTSFVQATTYAANFNTQTANAADFGNYVLLHNVAAAGGVISITAGADTQSWRSPLGGLEIVAVPEPTTLALSAAGLAALGLIRRRNK